MGTSFSYGWGRPAMITRAICTVAIVEGYHVNSGGLPSGKRLQKTMENHHAING